MAEEKPASSAATPSTPTSHHVQPAPISQQVNTFTIKKYKEFVSMLKAYALGKLLQ